MDEYYYDYGEPDDDEFYDDEPGPNILDIWNACVHPTILQITTYIGTFLLWNFVYRVTTQSISLPSQFQHAASLICGGIVMYFILGYGTVYFLAFTIMTFGLMFVTQRFQTKICGYILTGFCLSVLAIGELLTDDMKLWHQIRGTQMIAAMKMISLGFDLDTDRVTQKPGMLEFYGYVMCPANCVLGPWVSYSEYLANYQRNKWKIIWIFWIILNVFISIVFLMCSNCLINAIIGDNSWHWLIAYRDAMAFRFSHYFISYLSQSLMLTAGFSAESPENQTNIWGYQITKPWKIELPRSLVQVVIVWNMSMHSWLKTYIFRTIKPYGIVLAICCTYVISSLLHGINFQLAAVLLSLGTYTFVEYRLRQKLANIFNSCIAANPCKTCTHEHGWNQPYVLLVNIFFSFMAVMHLAYLGVMFEASTAVQERGFSVHHAMVKWSNLNFLSHWIVAFSYLFYIVI